MTDRQFCYPRVVPAPPKAPPPPPVRREARGPGGQRDLVAASLVRCPPRRG